MAVDLADLIPSLQREVSPPGTDLFPDATDDEWLGYLQDGFWEAVMDGVLSATYTETDGSVTPVSGTVDLSRDLQQVIVFYAGFRIALTAYRNQQTKFRAVAGPVEFETNQSATVLTDLLRMLAQKRDILLRRLSDLGVTPSFYYDSVQDRTTAILDRLTYWTR